MALQLYKVASSQKTNPATGTLCSPGDLFLCDDSLIPAAWLAAPAAVQLLTTFQAGQPQAIGFAHGYALSGIPVDCHPSITQPYNPRLSTIFPGFKGIRFYKSALGVTNPPFINPPQVYTN